MKLLYNISALQVRKTERKVMNKNLIAYNVAKLLADDFSNDMEILTDKRMLGLDKVEKIDNAVQADGLVLEKLLGNTSIPTESDTKRHTVKLDEETSDTEQVSTEHSVATRDDTENESDAKPHTVKHDEESSDTEQVSAEHSVATRDDTETESDSHDGVVPEGQSQYTWEGNPNADEDVQSNKKSKPASVGVGSIVEAFKKKFGKNINDTSSESEEYTKMTLSEYRKLLLKRSGLRIDIEELKDEIASGNDTTKNTKKLKELELEYHTIENLISGIKLFYAIDHIDDPMVISTIREYRDGFIIVINENNVRYRSIQSDIMSIALHVAEAMIKEIIYIEDKKIDKERLDSELSKFYERHYEQLLGGDLLSM